MSGAKRKATSSLYDDVREKMNTEGDAHQMKEYLKSEAEKVRNICDSIAKKYKKTGETETPRELLILFAFMSVRSELNDKQQLELMDKQLLNWSVCRYGQLKDGDIILDLTGLPTSHTKTGYTPADE